MNLFLLRHGLAVEREEFHFASDHLRPLTAKGKRQLHKIAAAMRAMKLNFDAIFSSPLVRARQTAEIVAMDLKLKKRLDFADELKPGSDARKLVQKNCRA
jgi:phosphohistidine phosphatase